MSYREDACHAGAGRPARPAARRAFGSITISVVIAFLLSTATAVIPAAAQDGDDTATTVLDPSTTAATVEAGSSSSDTTNPADSTTSSAADSTVPSTTVKPVESSESTGQPVATTTTISQQAEVGDGTEGSTDVTDPLIDEAPADDSLDPNVTVPPPTGAGADPQFAPAPILWSSLREAETKWADAVTAEVEAIVEVRILRLRAKELVGQRRALEDQTRLTVDELAAATERLAERAVRGFVQTSTGNVHGIGVSSEVFRSREVLVAQRKSRLVSAAVDIDQVSLSELAELRSTLGSSALELLQRSNIVDSSIRRAEVAAREHDAAVDQARIELEAFKAGSDIYVDGVVFPIGGPYSVPLINSFGFPRMPGTPDAHAHQGIDIFAPRGTPLVAAERGVIGRVGNGRLGGLKFWLRGESGADWYYAHLDGFAPGLHNGQVVEAGELLGYVGNTGNAVGTPPHLHLEIHPNGGAAVNPYPLLKVVSDLDLKSHVDGLQPDYRYQPVVANRPAETTASSSSTSSSTSSVVTTGPTVPVTTATTPTTTAATAAPTTVASTTVPTSTEATTTTTSVESTVGTTGETAVEGG